MEDNEGGCCVVTHRKGCGQARVRDFSLKYICFTTGDGLRRSFGMISGN